MYCALIQKVENTRGEEEKVDRTIGQRANALNDNRTHHNTMTDRVWSIPRVLARSLCVREENFVMVGVVRSSLIHCVTHRYPSPPELTCPIYTN